MHKVESGYQRIPDEIADQRWTTETKTYSKFEITAPADDKHYLKKYFYENKISTVKVNIFLIWRWWILCPTYREFVNLVSQSKISHKFVYLFIF